MFKEKRHIIINYVSNILYIKNEVNYIIFRSIKFNRNIKKKKQLIIYLSKFKRSCSVSKYKSVCVFTGYKRAIINKISSSRFVANKIAKHGLIHNYKP